MNKLEEIGKEMVEYAEQADFTAQRGLIDELFPFIYVASKRMNLHAIMRWLADNHRITISVNALAKAMRSQDEHWARLVGDVEPSARVMSDAYGYGPSEILDSFLLFQCLEAKPPAIASEDPEGIEKEFRRIAVAAGILRNRWFSQPEDVRNQCRRHFAGVFHEAAEPPKEEPPEKKGKRSERKKRNQ
ncbi:MAG: hypothetical protein LBW77_00550 [Verrucomicrobiota bacterium]|jgi:hypothetical protein|nr:hypothetical protein [Verrucomicrobiota bacterium]